MTELTDDQTAILNDLGTTRWVRKGTQSSRSSLTEAVEWDSISLLKSKDTAPILWFFGGASRFEQADPDVKQFLRGLLQTLRHPVSEMAMGVGVLTDSESLPSERLESLAEQINSLSAKVLITLGPFPSIGPKTLQLPTLTELACEPDARRRCAEVLQKAGLLSA